MGLSVFSLVLVANNWKLRMIFLHFMHKNLMPYSKKTLKISQSDLVKLWPVIWIIQCVLLQSAPLTDLVIETVNSNSLKSIHPCIITVRKLFVYHTDA